MRLVARTPMLALVAAIAVTIVGCGSSAPRTEPPTEGDPIESSAKIHEYRGDGGGSAKPIPALFAGLMPDSALNLGPKLRHAEPPRLAAVPYRQISWFRVGATDRNWIVCVQPTANEDSDLFVLEGTGSGYDDGAALLGASVRVPNASQESGLPGSLAPDWVYVQPGDTGKYPAAQVAVYGVPTGPTKMHYRIEAREVTGVSVGSFISAWLDQYESTWVAVDVTAGSSYEIELEDTGGDPDLYLYAGTTSSDFETEATNDVPTESVGWTATTTGTNIFRVYGSALGPNKFQATFTKQ